MMHARQVELPRRGYRPAAVRRKADNRRWRASNSAWRCTWSAAKTLFWETEKLKSAWRQLDSGTVDREDDGAKI